MTWLFGPCCIRAKWISARMAKHWQSFARQADRMSCARWVPSKTSAAFWPPSSAALFAPIGRATASRSLHSGIDLIDTAGACVLLAFGIPPVHTGLIRARSAGRDSGNLAPVTGSTRLVPGTMLTAVQKGLGAG